MAPKNTVVLWKNIHEIADKISKYYGLRYGKILPETRKQAQHYGECTPCDKCHRAEHIDERNCSDKILYIRVHQLNRPGVPLATSTILRTLAHELAHLRHWGHGKAHRAFEEEIVEYMQEELGYDVI
jgi:hypothetical protein